MIGSAPPLWMSNGNLIMRDTVCSPRLAFGRIWQLKRDHTKTGYSPLKKFRIYTPDCKQVMYGELVWHYIHNVWKPATPQGIVKWRLRQRS